MNIRCKRISMASMQTVYCRNASLAFEPIIKANNETQLAEIT